MNARERRIGVNEAMFREVNERFEALNDAFSMVTETMLVVCECGNTSCVEQFRMPVEEYESVRADPLLFVIKPGHAAAGVEDVVASHGEYEVIKKREERGADELAKATAPR